MSITNVKNHLTNGAKYDKVVLRLRRGKKSAFAPPFAANKVQSHHREREVLFVYAIIVTGGKQYKVSEGDIIFVEKLEAEEGSEYTFDQVLAVSGNDGIVVGKPTVAGASVKANVVKNGKGKKIYVFKYKSKKNEKKKIGHRQPYTKVQITAINA